MKTKIHPNNLYSFLKSKAIEWVDFGDTIMIFHFTDGTIFEVTSHGTGGCDCCDYYTSDWLTYEGFDNK